MRGVETDSYVRIVDMGSKIVDGEFRLLGGETVIGIELAKDLGVRVGDKIRLATPDERTQVFSVEGIFDAGNKDLNERWVFVPLRSAQTLLDLQGIAVRSGHHCAHPLMAFYGVPATCRASLAFYTTEAEVDALIDGIAFVRRMLG